MPFDEIKWSQSQKKIARAVFDRAYERECLAIRREIESMLNNARDIRVIWRIEDYLSKRRRETDEKYDYRHSRLILVFAQLYSEGWLTDEDIAELDPDKRQLILNYLRLR